MAEHDIVVVGGSAGGVESSRALVGGLPPDLSAAVFLVIHQLPQAGERLARVLSNAGPLPAIVPNDGDAIQPGLIHVAPGDCHLLIDDGRVLVRRGPTHNGHRPAVDPLFRSASRSYGPRVIGVVLSGALDDGAAGLATIHRRGGLAVVERPDTALFSSMPASALAEVTTDHVVAAPEIGALLGRLVTIPADVTVPARERALDLDLELFMGDAVKLSDERKASPFSCPECGGVLWQGEPGAAPDYQCRVGHSFTAKGLAHLQNVELERSLWAAVRSLEEHAHLNRRMLERFRLHRSTTSVQRAEETALESERHAAILRSFVTGMRETADE
jgi:two-component system chemotaxis response regulator CheB